MIANSCTEDHQTGDRLQSSKSCQHQSGKQWDGTDIFRNELCDAERFLEDLGFAGAMDPSIPERFVPSLLHRIATMPRTALWYLNHRILHTLILHKRKEQRRRLFRYSSVNNKELIESRSQILNLLHHYVAEGGIGKEAGLARALTGPADCSEKDVLSACQSARRCEDIPSSAFNIASTSTFSSNTPASSINCPISIYIEPPENHQSKKTKDAFDDSAKHNSFNGVVNKSEEANPMTILKESSLDSKSVQGSSLATINQRLSRSYSKFSKDQRRMVLQRCPAICRRRSASEPIILQSRIGFGCFPRKPVDSHISDKKPPPKDVLLPFSSQTSLMYNEIPFLWFKEYSLSNNNNNNYVNMWKKHTSLSDNSHMEIYIKIEVERSPFTRRNFIASKLRFPGNMSKTAFTFPQGNFRINCISKFGFMKLNDTLMPFPNITDLKLIVLSPEDHIFSTVIQIYPANRLVTKDLTSLFSECFSLLTKDNCTFYQHVLKTGSYSDEKTSKEKKALLAYHFLNHFGENKCKTISSYLLLCQSRSDNVQFVCSHGGILYDNAVVFEQFDTPPVLIITAMAENFLSKSDSGLTFSSELNVDIGPDGPSEPYFRSAVSLQFNNNKQLQVEPLTNAEDDNEKKEHKEPPSHSFFRKATKELIELQEFIKKAKINRESASLELKVLQDILLESGSQPNSKCSTTSSHRDKESDTSVKESTITPKLKETFLNYNGKQELQLVRSETTKDSRRSCDRVDALQLMVLQLQNEMLRFQQALSELQKKARMREESASSHVEKEIRGKIQLELEQECNSRVSKMEAKLKAAEQQLRVLQEENEDLRHQLLLESKPNSNLNQRTKNDQELMSLVNGFTPNGDIICHHIEEKKVNEEKLRDELRETEKRADRLNLMLDEKVVELNKLQLSLSKRTKEMVLVERAYVQLIYHLYRNNHSLGSISNLSTSTQSNDKEYLP